MTLTKKIAVPVAVLGSTFAASSHAALADHQTAIDGIVTAVTADIGTAVTAGITLLAVGLAARIGFGLLKSFLSSGAR